ncbi:MAG: M48 family metallopeptidase [Pseudomonadota bacterium]
MASNPRYETFLATFSDGKSAASDQARVRLLDRGVEIEVSGRAERKIWPYGALQSSEPLGPRSIEALLTYKYEPGANLYVSDVRFARALAEDAKHLTAGAQRWRQMRPLLWAMAAIAMVIGAVYAFQLSPARTIAGWLPDSTRDYMGEQVVSSMTANRQTCTSKTGQVALDRLIDRLSEAAGRKKTFKVVVVDWKLVNAFAAPGERIMLTEGLIKKSGSPDELAGVLAHEMGHGLGLHPETGIVRSLGLSAIAQLMLGGAGNLSNLGVMLTQLAYSRDAEREADTYALDVLRNARISPNGLAAFFRRIRGTNKAARGDSGYSSFDVLRSHPQTAERLRNVEAVQAYPATPALSAADWQALKSICSATQSK